MKTSAKDHKVIAKMESSDIKECIRLEQILKEQIFEYGIECRATGGLSPIIDMNIMDLRSLSKEADYLWRYCSFDVYKDNKERELSRFLKKFEDASGNDFWKDELVSLNLNATVKGQITWGFSEAESLHLIKMIRSETLKDIQYSQKRKREYVSEQLSSEEKILKLKWTGKQVELTELIKSLVVAKMFGDDLKENEIFRRFELLIDCPFKLNPAKAKSNIKDRLSKEWNDNSFLLRLDGALKQWVDEKTK